MRRKVLNLAIVGLTVMACLGCGQGSGPDSGVEQSAEYRDPDQKVLDQLAIAGSDLSKPHSLEFFVYFPTKGAAEAAESRLAENGFESEIWAPDDDSEWTLWAKKTMVPEHAAIVEIGQRLDALATELGGDYDGWGAEIVE